MPQKMPSGLKRLIRQRTGKSWYIITRTLNGKRVDDTLLQQIKSIVAEYAASKDDVMQQIKEL
jgi:hypothetical protein